MKGKIKKEIEEMKSVFDKLKFSSKGKELYQLAKAYLEDAEYFLRKGDFFRALEAVSISWAYVDAGLHLRVFRLPEELMHTFTAKK